MQPLDDLLTPGRICCRAPVISKKKLFETAAKVICDDQPSLSYEEVFSQLISREKLGSTGLGLGIAIPHCRLDACEQPIGALLTLQDAIDFEAPDGLPVDLVFTLLVPGEAHQQHLKILADIARLFSQGKFCHKLRAARSNDCLLYTSPSPRD